MGGFRLTNVAAGSAANQNPIISQIQDGSLLSLSTVSGTDTITGALSPSIASYTTNMAVTFKPVNTGTGAATIAINGLSAKSIVKGASTALVAGDLVSGTPAVIIYDGTNFVLQHPLGTLSAANGSALTNLNASNLASGTVPDGRFPATLPAASGVNLTALNATNLSSGTVPDARFPATLPAASGANLTALNASNLASGTMPDARFPATLPVASGANLTALNASNLSSGSIADARIAQSNVTQHQAALTIAESQITDGSVLARVAGNETISGAWNFSGTAPTIASKGVATTDVGSFTASMTGFGTPPTPTVKYSRSGNVVTLMMASSGVALSNTSGLTLSGLPSAIQGASSPAVPCYVEDNGAVINGWAYFAGGTITFGAGLTGSTGGFTNSGNKGLLINQVITYTIQ